MATLKIRVRNASRETLPDTFDLHVRGLRTGTLVADTRGCRGEKTYQVTVRGDEPYQVIVYPMRHRPVGSFAMVAPDGLRSVELHSAIIPERVKDVQFDDYAALADFDRVLSMSTVEGQAGAGQGLYAGLTPEFRAGLLNVFTKMVHTTLPSGRSTWSYVTGIYRVRPDRIFADVTQEFRDAVRAAEDVGAVTRVAEKLHEPPPGYVNAGSFKTPDLYGNLQLSFFQKQGGILEYKIDADIDDANGIAHAFQVVRNFLTGRPTHPYDIHELLTFHQELPVPYRLIV